MLERLNSAIALANSSIDRASSSEFKKSTKREAPFLDEIWQSFNFKPTQELIYKLQKEIDAKINQAMDEIIQGKDVQQNRELIIQSRKQEVNLHKMAEYIAPLAPLEYVLAEVIKFVLKTSILQNETQKYAADAPVLISRIKANQSLYSDDDPRIPDADFAPLLLEGKLLPFYEKLADLLRSALSTSSNGFLRMLDPSAVVIDEKAYVKNAEKLLKAFLKLDEIASKKGTDLLQVVNQVFDLDISRENLARIPAKLRDVIHELDSTGTDARLVSVVLDGSLNVLIKKLLETLKEFKNYHNLTAPLYTPAKEFKQEPESEITPQSTASIWQKIFSKEEEASAPKVESSPKAEPGLQLEAEPVAAAPESPAREKEPAIKHFVSRGRMFVQVPYPQAELPELDVALGDDAPKPGFVENLKRSFSDFRRSISR